MIELRLVECGLEAKGISVKYEKDLQSIEVVIRPAARAHQGHFKCIKDAVAHEIVTFEDGAMYTAYDEYRSEAARPQMLASRAASLQKSGLLKGFPIRGDFQTLSDYARALEKHAGTKPGAALRVDGDSIVFDPPQKPVLPADFLAQYSGLMSVVMYASVRDHISFAFIGNGAVSPDQ
jgi:hypothetical protein